ncbi:peptidoglycan-binding domain-containing protein [Nitrosomonas communis]|uniref:peptidoglycan-binding domain-containing protein n=1 Tax=Nitrosomonas communis TaxID=44574 RepID=UPI0026EB1A85|nr:peptidoglycan-binding domain-containing protein [Nitrosomonas communis]
MKLMTVNQLATSIFLLFVTGLLGCSDQAEVAATQNQEIAIKPIQKDAQVTELDLIAESTIDIAESLSEENNQNVQETIESFDQALDIMLSELYESENPISASTTGSREQKHLDWQNKESDSSEFDSSISENPIPESITETQLSAIESEQKIQELEDLSKVVEANSELIREVQQALVDAGFNPGAIDGVNGPRTMAALKSFQKQNNLAIGQLTKETLQRLKISY